MLKGIDPRLNADVLYALRAMGHGDLIVLTDTNFPADAIARQTVFGDLLRMDNLSLSEAAEAVLSVMPLDTFVEDFAGRMEVVGAPDEVPPPIAEVQAIVDRVEGKPRPIPAIERFDFYDVAREAYAVIQTGDRRFYANVMFRKGVVPPDA